MFELGTAGRVQLFPLAENKLHMKTFINEDKKDEIDIKIVSRDM